MEGFSLHGSILGTAVNNKSSAALAMWNYCFATTVCGQLLKDNFPLSVFNYNNTHILNKKNQIL